MRPLPKAFLVLLVLFLGMELTLASLSSSALQWISSYTLPARHGKLLTTLAALTTPRQADKPRVFMLGDSQAVYGLDSKIIETSGDEKFQFINLSVIGGRPTDYLWALSRIKPRPGDLTLVAFQVGNFNNTLNPEFMDFTQAHELVGQFSQHFWTSSPNDTFRSVVLEGTVLSFIPSLRLRDDLARFLLNYIKAVAQYQTLVPPAPKPFPEKKPVDEKRYKRMLAEKFQTQGKPNHWNEIQWQRADVFFTRLSEAKVESRLFSHPKLRGFEKTLSPGARADFDKNLDAVRQKHNLEMFSFPTELFQDSDYYDFVHHTQQGREKLSKLMGLWIADYFQAATASPSDTG
ncbi:MAG: hypothetical protein HOK97_17870, partial [Deltaproteobacteria bacterium]|nr:hypothetical protein [Deltaproteobacteria bacterium]